MCFWFSVSQCNLQFTAIDLKLFQRRVEKKKVKSICRDYWIGFACIYTAFFMEVYISNLTGLEQHESTQASVMLRLLMFLHESVMTNAWFFHSILRSYFSCVCIP